MSQISSPELEKAQDFGALSEVEDPLELAASALVKLREAGHSGVIRAEDLVEDVAEETQAEVVVDLDEYRSKTQPAAKPENLSIRQREMLVKRSKNGDRFATERLAECYLEISNSIAWRMGSQIPIDDLVQAALAQLPGAIERYDPAVDANFNSFYYHRIVGAMQDEERKSAYGEKLSRHSYMQFKEAVKSEDPNEALHELAKKGIPVSNLTTNLDGTEVYPNVSTSLEGMIYAENGSMITGLEPVSSENVVEEVMKSTQQVIFEEFLEENTKTLTDNERLVLTSYFGLFGLDELTLREIGDTMGITESRASQLKTRAIEKLEQSIKTSQISSAREIA